MISIVIAYYNRKKLFIETLKSMAKSSYKDFEVIAVDDGSRKEERLEDLDFDFLKVVRVEPKDKWYFNSCIPYNIGIEEARGDIIVLQNPECLHVHDVISYVSKTVDDSNYVSISAYSFNEGMTKYLTEAISFKNGSFIETFKLLPQKSVIDFVGWYNHSKYRPVHYHFCAALTRNSIKKLGGFDKRYAMGIGYEDNEFIDRVRRLGLKMVIADDVSVIHQWHPKVYDLIDPVFNALYKKNGVLHKKTERERIIHV